MFGAIQATVFSLLAIGFSLLYGVGGILNIAHGAFYLLASYLVFWLIPFLGYPMGIVMALVLVSVLGGLFYLTFIKKLHHNHVAVLIITFALAFLLLEFFNVFEGRETRSLPRFIPGTFPFLGFNFDIQYLFVIFGGFAVIASLFFLINKTRLGKSIRAVAQDKEAAMLLGIDANKILLITMVLSVFLAGVSAVLYAPAAPFAPYQGWDFLVTAFSIVVLGGLGSLKGSVVGALIIAYTKTILNFIDPAWSGLVPIIIIVIMLLFRPQGLFGKKEIK